MSELFRSSASQINTSEDCFRKWGLEKIDGVPKKANKYANLGSECHTALEEWLGEGILLPANRVGEICTPALPHIPPPNTQGLEIEIPFKRPLDGVLYRGKIDVRIPYPYRDVPLVSDHKTTSNFKWALTPEGMVDDAQATLYAWDTILDSQERGYKGDVCDLQWTYMRTTGAPKAKPVKARMSMAELMPRLEKTKATARQQRLLRESVTSALDIPPNANACEAYGGCPYVEVCNLSPSQRIRSIMSQGNAHNAFMAKLAARRVEAGQAEATQPHPAPVEAPASVPAKSGTVNPPEAPAEAPASPPAAPEAPASAPKIKGRSKGSKNKEKAATTELTPALPAPPLVEAGRALRQANANPPAVTSVVAVDPMALVKGLLEAAKDGRAIVVMVIPNGQG